MSVRRESGNDGTQAMRTRCAWLKALLGSRNSIHWRVSCCTIQWSVNGAAAWPVKLSDVTPHVLRHSFASIANDLGFTEVTIAALVGHVEFKQTAYALDRDSRKATLARFLKRASIDIQADALGLNLRRSPSKAVSRRAGSLGSRDVADTAAHE